MLIGATKQNSFLYSYIPHEVWKGAGEAAENEGAYEGRGKDRVRVTA